MSHFVGEVGLTRVLLVAPPDLEEASPLDDKLFKISTNSDCVEIEVLMDGAITFSPAILSTSTARLTFNLYRNLGYDNFYDYKTFEVQYACTPTHVELTYARRACKLKISATLGPSHQYVAVSHCIILRMDLPSYGTRFDKQPVDEDALHAIRTPVDDLLSAISRQDHDILETLLEKVDASPFANLPSTWNAIAKTLVTFNTDVVQQMCKILDRDNTRALAAIVDSLRPEEQ